MKSIILLIIMIFFMIDDQNNLTDELNQSQEFSEYTQGIPGIDSEIDMIPVVGGTFMMGAAGGQHEVRVDDFWMGKYEITWQQYEEFSRQVINELQEYVPNSEGEVQISIDALSIPTPPYVEMSFGMGRDGYPAISMTHYAAVMFTKWLTARTGEFFRLPTEAEWEYACIGGSGSNYSIIENRDVLDTYEWHSGNSDSGYKRVGSKEPNPLGLYDMAGNIAEWTTDQYFNDYADRLEGDIADNPWFRPEELYPRAVRGGSWRDEPEEARCTNRRGSNANWKILDPQFPKSLWWHTSAAFVGFRIVRPLETPSPEEIEQYWIEAMEDL